MEFIYKYKLSKYRLKLKQLSGGGTVAQNIIGRKQTFKTLPQREFFILSDLFGPNKEKIKEDGEKRVKYINAEDDLIYIHGKISERQKNEKGIFNYTRGLIEMEFLRIIMYTVLKHEKCDMTDFYKFWRSVYCSYINVNSFEDICIYIFGKTEIFLKKNPKWLGALIKYFFGDFDFHTIDPELDEDTYPFDGQSLIFWLILTSSTSNGFILFGHNIHIVFLCIASFILKKKNTTKYDFFKKRSWGYNTIKIIATQKIEVSNMINENDRTTGMVIINEEIVNLHIDPNDKHLNFSHSEEYQLIGNYIINFNLEDDEDIIQYLKQSFHLNDSEIAEILKNLPNKPELLKDKLVLEDMNIINEMYKMFHLTDWYRWCANHLFDCLQHKRNPTGQIKIPGSFEYLEKTEPLFKMNIIERFLHDNISFITLIGEIYHTLNHNFSNLNNESTEKEFLECFKNAYMRKMDS
jgi:hypothetical protein